MKATYKDFHKLLTTEHTRITDFIKNKMSEEKFEYKDKIVSASLLNNKSI